MAEKIISRPSVRFKGFEGDWEHCKLGEILNWSKGDKLAKSVLNKEHNGKSVLHYADLYKFGAVQKNVINWSTSEEGRLIPDNSILFPMSDVTPFGLARTTNLLVQGVMAGSDVLIGTAPTSVSAQFLSYQINARPEKILPLVTGTTVKHINSTSLSNVDVHCPSFEEQTNLGSLFVNIDDTITLHHHKCDVLNEMKRSFLKKMFPGEGENNPKIRFSGYADAWEQRKLGELGSVAMNKRIFKEETSENGDVPFFKIGTLDGVPDAYISREKYQEYKFKYPYPLKGDLLISASGSIGKIVEYKGEDAYFQDSNIVWLKHDDRVVNIFLRQFYQKVKWSGLEGSTIQRLYNKNILETEIDIPSAEEQMQIGAFFQTLDNLITLHQRKLETLKNMKKTLLKQMFI